MKPDSIFEKGSNNRRRFLLGAATAATSIPVLSGLLQAAGPADAAVSSSAATLLKGRRKLGKLEVSSVGIGVQNMSRTYQTTIPNRAEMHRIIRSAFDHGLTFYDAAEASGSGFHRA